MRLSIPFFTQDASRLELRYAEGAAAAAEAAAAGWQIFLGAKGPYRGRRMHELEDAQ